METETMVEILKAAGLLTLGVVLGVVLVLLLVVVAMVLVEGVVTGVEWIRSLKKKLLKK
jgi:hypothetical protein